MTTNAPNGKLPPRLWMDRYFLINPRCDKEFGPACRIKIFSPYIEYLSLEEHDHILTEAANKIERLQAKISELDQQLLTANSKIKEARVEIFKEVLNELSLVKNGHGIGFAETEKGDGFRFAMHKAIESIKQAGEE